MMQTAQRRVLGLPLLLVGVMLISITAAIAAPPDQPDSHPTDEMTIDARLASAAPDEFAVIESIAADEGSVRVIVGLQMRWSPEPLLDSAAQVNQVSTIDSLQGEIVASLAGTDHVVHHRYSYVPYMALELSTDAVEALEASGLVASLELDVADPPALGDTIPLVNADDAWALGFEGTGQVVAILDTGVDSSHSFFAGRVVEEACFSLGSDCPNASTTQLGTGAGVHCSYSGDCDHGTHVAGIAAGYASPGDSGVARDADIMAIQVFSRFDSVAQCSPRPSPCALSYSSDQLAGLERVYALRDTHDFAAANVSIGGGREYAACDTDSRKAGVDNLLAAGIATVVSAGNDGYEDSTTKPACISTAISVASSTKADGRSSFSNTAPFVDLIAPGSLITSAVPGGGYGVMSGTSMAAPHVTGAWAVIREAYPDASVADILQAFKDTGPLIQVRSGPDEYLPRIDVLATLEHLRPGNDDFGNAVGFTPPLSASVSTVGATTETGEPLLCNDPDVGLSPFGATVWYDFTPSEDLSVTVDTAGSDFDTVVGIYTGGSVGSLTQVACDDDHLGSSSSNAAFTAMSGVTYRVQVGGYGSTPVTGNANVSITATAFDDEVPTWPPGSAITVVSTDAESVSLSWDAAEDNVGVAGYIVYVDGTPWVSTGATAATVTGLQPETTYTIVVEAFDAAGNDSTNGPTIQVTTAASGVLAPTWPAGSYVEFDSISTDGLDVAWSPAEDDLAVTVYAVWTDTDLQGYTSSRSFTIEGLDPATDYWVTITAGDDNGNWTHGPAGWVTTATDFLDTGGSVFQQDIIWLSGAGITAGCNPPWNDLFCPDDFVTRGQMAAFLVRALGLTDDGGGNLFDDDDGSVFEPSIDRLAASGITKGCNPPDNDEFCPDDFVTRGQMAAFLVRAVGYTDNGGGDLFIDDDGSVFEAAIDKLGTAGVTRGCNPPINDRYCPDDRVTRGQMAAFLRRALG